MKRLENLLLKGCGFTILILSLFYTFATIGNVNLAKIDFATFILIFFFGLLISLTTLILNIPHLKYPIRVLIHYASLLTTFFVVFLSTGNIKADTPANVFSAVIVFTALYSLLFGITALVKKLVKNIDKKMDGKSQASKTRKNDNQSYKSIYTDN